LQRQGLPNLHLFTLHLFPLQFGPPHPQSARTEPVIGALGVSSCWTEPGIVGTMIAKIVATITKQINTHKIFLSLVFIFFLPFF
jgi:hypothetical protein